MGVLTPPPRDDAPTALSSPSDADGEPTVLTPGPAPPFDDLPTLVPGQQATAVSATVVRGDNGDQGPPKGDQGPLRPGQSFGPRYYIIRPLGVGGMGAVYQAWDAELAEAVAIKVIRPEVMADPRAAREIEQRFKRELQLARQVTHKNVIRIHDLGEIGGIKYITMSYVEGTDLATVLRKEGTLDVTRTLSIIRGVVAGLVAAHSAGVVHRDLKPANIMIGTDGESYLMDFGIARSVATVRPRSQPAADRPADLRRAAALSMGATMPGAVLGTVQYMAPEQARDADVDQRADIYALGLIVSDMLLGKRHRSGAEESALDELKRRMEQAPALVRTVDASIPEAVERVISRCLEPDPAARFQTSAELAAALDRLDENGKPLPIHRVVGMRVMAAVVVLLLGLSTGVWWYQRQFIPPPEHDPVSVVIADFQNTTGDAAFDRTLEPMLKRALEDASFINAYDRGGMSALGVRPPEKLDEAAARDIALKQGLTAVLSGSLERQGNRYEISIRAVQSVTGNVITTARGRASDKDQIFGEATKLMISVRKALGDDTSDSVQMYAINTASASSPEVMRHYVAGREAAASGNFEEAQLNFREAVDVDPKFGLGYLNLAIMSQNQGNLQDAEINIKKAFSLLAGMTERERYGVRGRLYMITGDYQQCVKEYGEMIGRYAADVNARLSLASCWSFLRNMPKALDETRQTVKILPKRPIFRINLALYETYAGNFQTGEQEARTVQELGNQQWGLFSLAFAQIGQGQSRQAAETYQELAKVNAQGASQAASGLGDLAIVEGRFSEAIRILQEGADADLASKNPDTAAAKFAALAHAHLLLGQKRSAVAAAEKAYASSKAVKIRFLAARVFVEAGEIARAQKLAAELASEPQAEPRAYAKIIEAGVALQNGNPQQAIQALTEANSLLDTWIGHFDLGRAYFEAGLQGTSGTGLRALDDFAQAESEFDRCIKRRGEALSLFLDEEPTYGYSPPVYYYQGRVREELKIEGFADSYHAYLNIRGQSKEDPLLPEVRRRAGS